MGRPAGDPAQRRSAIITVRVTEEQHARIVEIAQREGLLVSELGHLAIAAVIRRGSAGTAVRTGRTSAQRTGRLAP
jgi:hypothetical protein